MVRLERRSFPLGGNSRQCLRHGEEGIALFFVGCLLCVCQAFHRATIILRTSVHGKNTPRSGLKNPIEMPFRFGRQSGHRSGLRRAAQWRVQRNTVCACKIPQPFAIPNVATI